MIADAEYPEQTIYMPTAVSKYLINSLPLNTSAVPTPGGPSRYLVDLTGNKLIIPLGVYRAGVNNDGAFSVDISINTDTVSKLITSVDPAVKLNNTELLPSDKYSLPVQTMLVESGTESKKFDFNVDLDFLRANIGKVYAIGVSINSPNIKTNLKLATTVIVLDTKFMKPAAAFTSKADATDPKKILFTDTSTYALNYSWNFGDGSAVSTEKSPSHVYSPAGTYTVIHTVTGVTGDLDKSTITTVVTVL
jgi:PKD repeat protein